MTDNSVLLTMNLEQMAAYNAAIQGRNIFLTGRAGTGKTYTLVSIIKALQESGKNVMVTAPTGIAASQIGGTTIHLAFSWGINSYIDTVIKRIKTKTVDLLKDTDTLVVDEISMVRRDLFDAIWKATKKANSKRETPIQIIVAGDFFQLPPVVDLNRRQDKMLMQIYPSDYMNVFAFQSESWKECGFENHVLTQIFRQKHPQFMNILNKIRIGMIDRNVVYFLNGLYYSTEEKSNAIYIFGSNKAADTENSRRLNAIQEKEFIFPAIQKFDNSDGRPVEPLPEPLHLKVGSRVMFTANDHPQWWESREPQYFNGTMGTVVAIQGNPLNDHGNTVTVETDNEKKITVRYVSFEDHEYRLEDGKLIMRVCREYLAIPLKLGWAITVHKSQGLTLPAVVIYPQFFTDGQTYVAFSRCPDPDNIHLAWTVDPNRIKVNSDVYEFYSSLKAYKEPLVNSHDNDTVTYPSSTKGGAPNRYKNDVTIMKVPTEMVDRLKKFLDVAFPKNGSGTVRSKVDMMLSFLQKTNEKITVPDGAKKKFPNKAKPMRVPSEIANELDRFILGTFCGTKGSEKHVKAFVKEVNRIIKE